MVQELRLQPQEEAVFAAWFRELSHGNSRVPGAVAADFLKKSNLPQQQLKHIWDICDSDRLGSISQVGEHALGDGVCNTFCRCRGTFCKGLPVSACRAARARRPMLTACRRMQAEFYLALRLVALAQNGLDPSSTACSSFQVIWVYSLRELAGPRCATCRRLCLWQYYLVDCMQISPILRTLRPMHRGSSRFRNFRQSLS